MQKSEKKQTVKRDDIRQPSKHLLNRKNIRLKSKYRKNGKCNSQYNKRHRD